MNEERRKSPGERGHNEADAIVQTPPVRPRDDADETMAAEQLYGKPAGAVANAPPPSTLAAQLVENLPASTKSTRSDENTELRSLSAVIERVKNKPGLLRTPDERTEHNHMLIYVYSRVVLDGIKLDDPFADKKVIRSEALKAINFLKVTIEETPIVMNYTTDGKQFVFRGEEPLWVWVFPKVLKLLGHARCLDLTAPIEEFFRFIILVVSGVGSIGALLSSMLLYLRETSNALLSRLQETAPIVPAQDATIDMSLPPAGTLELLLGKPGILFVQQTTYAIPHASQAVRQAAALISTLAHPSIARYSSPLSRAPFVELRLWLLDSLLSLRAVQNTWQPVAPSAKADLLNVSLGLLPDELSTGKKALLPQKAYTSLALLCAELAARPDEIAGPDESSQAARRTLCKALLRLAQVSLVDREIGRLAAPQVVWPLELLCIEVPVLGEPSDFSRSISVLKQATAPTVPSKLDDATLPARFTDTELRTLVERLGIAESDIESVTVDDEPATKRRKVLTEGNELVELTARIDEVLGVVNDLGNLEHKFLNAYPHINVKSQCLAIDLISRTCCAADAITQTGSPFAAKDGKITCDWCLQGLHSSIREIRIASGRALALFLKKPASSTIDISVVRRNRKNALGLLKAASEKDAVIFHETGVMAWSQLGRVVTGDELNIVLHQLLEYLGSSNSLISSCAFNEINNLAAARHVAPRRLFEPFWRNLAYFAVKDMVARPQISRSLAEILQISVNEFLLLIQTHALPWLVLMKKRDVIQKIAEARGEKDVGFPVMDSINIGPVLGLLLVQDVPDVAQFTMARLVEFAPTLADTTLADVIQAELVMVVLELLKAAAEADEARKARVIDAITTMCNLVMAANKEKPKKGNLIGRFLQAYMLGLMARLADVINDFHGLCLPPEEQIRCIRALEEAIKLCQSYVRIARPHIAACLLSAIAQDELREAAFSCWAVLLTYLEEEDVEVLLETTFFIINHYWPVFDDNTRIKAKHLISTIIKHFSAVIEMYIWKLPSLAHIPELAEVEAQLQKVRRDQPIESRTAFAIFAARVAHENSGVVLQALRELVAYLKQHSGSLQTSAIGQQPDPVLSTLLRALLDCASEYSTVQPEIASLCTQCIGLVGCLDSNRIEAVREQKSMVLLNNFENADETTDFVLFILEQILVKAFLSTTDTKLQGFLSFAMQELLDKVDIKAACAFRSTGMRDGDLIYRKWLTLPEGIRETLTPFLTSKYVLTPVTPAPVEYPIFRPGKPYGNWMRSFTMDLLRRGQNWHADLIFGPLARTIRVKDVAVAEFLLPYLVLHVIIGNRSTRKDRDNIIGELVGILQHQLAEDAPYAEREDTKLYCEAVFRVLDYASRWLQEKNARRKNDSDLPSIARVDDLLSTIPPVLISQRAMDCREYPRALFHLEQHAQQMEVEKSDPQQRTLLLEQLQDIYTQIDEPDGLEGISAHLHVLDINQQILSHKKAGRYTAAQTWYEIKLAEEPNNIDVQVDLLNCLKQSGQHDVLLNYVEAAMELSRPKFCDSDISSSWLSSARLARKANSTHQSFNAVLHASQLQDNAAVIENARLLWKDGHTRKAIQVLQGAIESNNFMTQTNSTSSARGLDSQQRLLTARAQLMLAKWLDAAGQTNNAALRVKYQQPPKTNSSWEKGHYYLGRYYKKLLETEKPLKPDEQSDAFVQGEIARLVIENYLRSLNYGTKYLYQTLPRILTLWLELGAQVDKAPEGKVSLSRELHRRRTEQLNLLHAFLDKYIARLPAYIFYTALPQIVARIAHQNQAVFERLTRIVTKVVESHPRQALWGLFGIMTTRQASERRVRGQHILQALKGISKKVEGSSYDLKQLLRMGEKLAEQLLLACNNGDFQSNRTTVASITRDLNFNHKCTPCPLVVPIESCLTATLPTLTDNVKKHKAFSQDVITIDSFLDEVLVLGSLAKPRRLTCRGTDGKNYMLMIKPKDDLRTDQRLMEFNGMINRSLKRDAEASRRQLYIKTYAVVPLNEECGIIEWVDGLKTLREILLDQYKSRSVHPDYNQIKRMMSEAVTGPNNIKIFTEGVLGTFPPVLQYWFVQRFPHPSTWFSARLKYTRSCAVMSMVGTILGLGDRHGENVLLERDNGGIFHVDFNCLFDKGLTFAQPERVPFRLTHNMVAAMGIYGYEGPFRHCSELTLGILRQQEETLMTILEAFIYDPTLDLQKEKKTSRRSDGAPRMQPQLVVDSIKRKDGVCKQEAQKCMKGSLRFGTWTEIMGHGSWRWKHWGCVSGEQISHLRDIVERGGGYDFDAVDGYDEMGEHSDLQQKIRDAIKQGHISAEDFNGDPWMNKPGQRGIRGKKPKDWDDGEEGDEAKDEAPAPAATNGKKRGRKSAGAADEDEEEKPKKRAKKAAAKAEPEDEEKPMKAPAKRGKAAAAAKAAAAEDDEEEEKPKKAPAKRGARKSAVKEESDEEEEAPKKPAAKRGARKSAMKEESEEEEEKPAPKRGAAAKKTAPKRAATKKAKVEESEESEAEPDATPESEEEEEKPAPKKAAPKGRKKAAAAPAAAAEDKPKRGRARK
ncbi:Protein kinase rad3 [Colletotrichum sp. SAR 10_96]|nr:Protein kinase rad3 [Colletotrichum sp. SAR 10_96]